jgi:hypothetical protein
MILYGGSDMRILVLFVLTFPQGYVPATDFTYNQAMWSQKVEEIKASAYSGREACARAAKENVDKFYHTNVVITNFPRV